MKVKYFVLLYSIRAWLRGLLSVYYVTQVMVVLTLRQVPTEGDGAGLGAGVLAELVPLPLLPYVPIHRTLLLPPACHYVDMGCRLLGGRGGRCARRSAV